MNDTLSIEGRDINLTQVLKVSGLADSGGSAKAMIGEGKVLVNGSVELRKRRQMAVGDIVETESGERVVLIS